MDPERVVAEARSLEANEVFTTVLGDIHASAIEGLLATPAHETDTMRDHQAMARAINDIRARVRLLLLTNTPKAKSGL